MKRADHLRRAIVAVCVASIATCNAFAQNFPNKPIRIITPFAAGSGADVALRVVSEKMSKTLGQAIIIDNKPGGNGIIAIEVVKKAAPDGYTFVHMNDGHMALVPHLYKKPPYDTIKDFDPLGSLSRTHFFVVTAANSPLKSSGDIAAAARAKPGVVTYGSWGVGSSGHVGGAMLEAESGTQMSHVPFKDIPVLFQSVAAGDVAWSFGTAASAGPLYRAGKLKFLAVTAPKRVAGYTEVPTMAEAGGPANFELKAWLGLLAPKDSPPEAKAAMNAALAKALAEPDVKDKFVTFGFEPFVSTPAEMRVAIEADNKRFSEIARRAKISLE